VFLFRFSIFVFVSLYLLPNDIRFLRGNEELSCSALVGVALPAEEGGGCYLVGFFFVE